MKIIVRIIINAIALWVTAQLLPGIGLSGDIVNLLIVAVVFGLVNAFIRPIVKLLTLPINVFTLGLFSLVINALMLILTAWLTGGLTIAGGIIDGFLTALLGGIIISIVSTVLSWFLPDD
jgi:putative membrane protein